MEGAGIFYGHLIYFKALWYAYTYYSQLVFLWLFGIFYLFGMLYQEKSGNPDYLSSFQKAASNNFVDDFLAAK
jgi:hypothetical protein